MINNIDRIVVEASPLDTLENPSETAKVELYSQRFNITRIANIRGKDKPVKLFGFWESDTAFGERLSKWEAEEKLRFFEGWVCKDMYHYHELYCPLTNTIITVEYNEYEINHNGQKFLNPLPETINDFILDLKRIDVKLFWKPEFAEIYGIRSITSNKTIISYHDFIKSLVG